MLATERFGPRWTGTEDFDEDLVSAEITDGDVTALVAWQATLPQPGVDIPNDQRWQQAAADGELVFTSTGCTCLLYTSPSPRDRG